LKGFFFCVRITYMIQTYHKHRPCECCTVNREPQVPISAASAINNSNNRNNSNNNNNCGQCKP